MSREAKKFLRFSIRDGNPLSLVEALRGFTGGGSPGMGLFSKAGYRKKR